MSAFERDARDYDVWYETPKGSAIFREEIAALRPLLSSLPEPWMEVGVGTGRFAVELGVSIGLDLARHPLAIARSRGISVLQGRGERLPVRDDSLGAVLVVTTLEFVRDPPAVLREVRRVIRRDGALVLGVIYAESPWGRYYQRLGEAGHRYYRYARFLTRGELSHLLIEAGLDPIRSRSALFWSPTDAPANADGSSVDDLEAGFTAVLARPVEDSPRS